MSFKLDSMDLLGHKVLPVRMKSYSFFFLLYKSIDLQLAFNLVLHEKYFEKHFSEWLHPFILIAG